MSALAKGICGNRRHASATFRGAIAKRIIQSGTSASICEKETNACIPHPGHSESPSLGLQLGDHAAGAFAARLRSISVSLTKGAGDFRRFPSLRRTFKTARFSNWAASISFLFGLLLPPGKSRACDSKLARADGEMLAPREHVLAGRKIHDALARRAASGGSGLDGLACYPSEGSLAKMLYRAGFSAVYRVTPLPEHDDFRETRTICGGGRFCWRLSNRSMWGVSAFIRNRSNAKIRGRSSPRPVRVSRSGIARFIAQAEPQENITLALRARASFRKCQFRCDCPCAWWLAEKSAMDTSHVRRIRIMEWALCKDFFVRG